MKLLSVNRGRPRPDGDRRAKTGIYKEPVETAYVGELGLEGDAVVNKKHHGGPGQAVYLYATEDYAWWSKELGYVLAPGTFGENLTTEGLDVTGLAVGDRLTIGEVELEVTAPRIPCATLERRMGEPGFVKRYMVARRPGAYLRVFRTGRLAAGDAVILQTYTGERVGILELFETFFEPNPTEAQLRRFLSVPLADRAQAQKEEQLKRIG